MKCPNCDWDVDFKKIKVEINAEEDGLEVNFDSPFCDIEHFAILRPIDFEPVD